MLYSFEAKDIFRKLLPGWNYDIRCIDEYEEKLDNSHIPGGQGCVATLWADWLDPFMKSSQGDNRILHTEFCLGGRAINIVNCYLPSGTAMGAKLEFMDRLADIEERIARCEPGSEVVVLGDLNADQHSRRQAKEIALSDMIHRQQLHDLCAGYSHIPTYINVHLGHSSHIDHVLTKTEHRGKWSEVKLLEESPLNTSKHLLLYVTTRLSYEKNSQKVRQNKMITKLHWNLMDAEKYAEVCLEELDRIDITLLPPQEAVVAFQNIINTASLSAIPQETVIVRNHKKKNLQWSVELSTAVKACKEIFYQWKSEGRPTSGTIYEERKASKKRVKAISRQQLATDRVELINEISNAAEWDQSLFHKLIRKQRKSLNPSQPLLVGGQIITDSDRQRECWAEYYEVLGKPDDVCEEYSRAVENMRLLAAMSEDTCVTSTKEIENIINKLNRNKAPDKQGLKAEHLSLLPPTAVTALASIFNSIIRSRKVPPILKHAYKLPIPKPRKDPKIQDNFRGITVTSIFLKVLEAICIEQEAGTLNKDLSDLQFGFTEGRSPAMASLLITEAIAEARETKTPLYINTLDARKAFDVVCQDKLRMKIFHTDVKRPLWQLIDDMYIKNTGHTLEWRGQPTL